MDTSTFLYYFVGIFPLYFASTNTQYNFITRKRKGIIFTFIALVCFLIAPLLEQATTPLVLLGVCFLLVYRQHGKLIVIISFFLGYLLQVCLDFAFAGIALFFLHLTIQEIRTDYLLVFCLIYIPLIFVFTKFLGWLLHKKLKIETLICSSNIFLILCINTAISVAIFVVGIIYGEKLGYPPTVIYFNMFLFITYFILGNVTFFVAYRTVKRDSQLQAQLEHYENLNSYTKEVERLYQDIHCFKHDYLDILSSMKGYIDSKDTEALSSYFYDEILPLNEKLSDSDSRLGMLAHLKDEAMKSVVAAKLMIAIEKGLHVSVEVTDDIDITSINRVDFIRVLGILLNNATEAAIDSAEKNLTIAFIKENPRYRIVIRNSSPLLTIPIGSLCTRNVSGKETHNGLGLYNAKKIIDSCKNVRWKLDYQAPFFTAELNIDPNI